MNTCANTCTTDEFIERIYDIINIALNKDGETDMQYFDTIRLLGKSNNSYIKMMMDDIRNKGCSLEYAVTDQDAFDYGNYFGDINILIDGEVKYILEMTLGKEYIDYDFVGLNIYNREWKARLN